MLLLLGPPVATVTARFDRRLNGSRHWTGRPPTTPHRRIRPIVRVPPLALTRPAISLLRCCDTPPRCRPHLGAWTDHARREGSSSWVYCKDRSPSSPGGPGARAGPTRSPWPEKGRPSPSGTSPPRSRACPTTWPPGRSRADGQAGRGGGRAGPRRVVADIREHRRRSHDAVARTEDRLGPGRHPRGQRRHLRVPHPLEHDRRGLGRHDRRQPLRHLQMHAGRAARDDRAALRAGHRHLVRRRSDRRAQPGSLRGQQVGRDRPGQDASPSKWPDPGSPPT